MDVTHGLRGWVPVLLLTMLRPVAFTDRGSLSCNAGFFKLLSLRMYNRGLQLTRTMVWSVLRGVCILRDAVCSHSLS